MKNIKLPLVFLTVLCVFVVQTSTAQTKPKKPATNQGMPSDADVEKMMKAQGMSAEEIKMMKEMMNQQGNSPAVKAEEAMEVNIADAQFIPAKNTAKVGAIKSAYTQAELIAQTNTLFTKLTAKGKTTEITLAKKLIAELKTVTDLLNAAAVAMSNGQMHSALLVALKALQMNPDNQVAQNNVAALLTQCGYPEKALPYLIELIKKDPGNSTLLNNAAFAWLGLGDENKAYNYVYRALRANPSHPQASSCAAAILEKKGMKQQAEQLMKTASSTNFTASMQSLRGRYPNLDKTGDMNWNELKKKITIYEFFKPDDKKINWPEKNNVVNVKDLAGIQQIAQSEDAMRKSFSKKIEALLKNYEKEMEREMGDEKKAMSAMMKNAGKGNPGIVAVSNRVINGIMQSMMKFQSEHSMNYMQQIIDENVQIGKDIENKFIRRNAESGNEMCDRIGNRLVNEQMSSRNPWILYYLKDYEEEHRVQTNALLTWTSIQATATAMPEYLSKQQLIGFALNYLGVSAIQNFGSLSSSELSFPLFTLRCKNYETLPKLNYEEPLLPKFDCPIVYSIPSGFSKMGNLESLSKNDFNIPQTKINQFTQSSTSYSASGNSISEAGSSPYLTTDNTSTDISFGISDDDDLVPLAKGHNIDIDDDDELVPLAPSPKKVTGSDDDDLVPLAPSKKTRDAQAAADRKATQELLNQYSERFCKDELGQKADRKAKLQEKINKLLQELERQEQEEIAKAEAIKNTVDDDAVPLAKSKPEDIKKYYSDAKAAAQEVAKNGGLTPSISNGLTVAGKAPGFVKGMFD